MKNEMALLGYTEEWLQFGIVSEEKIKEQNIELEKSDDKNTEHYRSKAFQEYIRNKSKFTDEEIENIFGLKDAGADNCNLHNNRIYELILSNKLNDNQFERLIQHSEVFSQPISKIYQRMNIIREINKNGLTEKIFSKIKEIKDKEIQKKVLERNDIQIEQVEWLSQNGLNNKIKNIAKTKLRKRNA